MSQLLMASSSWCVQNGQQDVVLFRVQVCLVYYLLFIIGFIAHTKLQIIGTRVGNKVSIVWLRVYRLSLPIA